MTRWPRPSEPNAQVIRNPFEIAAQTPAVQALRQRVEAGESLPRCDGVAPGAQAFFAVLLRKLFPQRPLVLVTAGLKSQESLLQDVETWLAFVNADDANPEAASSAIEVARTQLTSTTRLLFYPAWEVLPHEAKLPHADVISERLETLVALASASDADATKREARPLIVTTTVALMQRTFSPQRLQACTRQFTRGHRIEPLDLIEWLEEQGYEPEAQVTQKGEIALRGGILDVFPPTSPWPVRLEFFGDELESIRQFDPVTQISRAEISDVTIPPAGELGMLKRHAAKCASDCQAASGLSESLASLLDYLPGETLFVLCEPDSLAEQAGLYAAQIPEGDLFFLEWNEFQIQAQRRNAVIQICGEEVFTARDPMPAGVDDEIELGIEPPLASLVAPTALPLGFASLDPFRPLAERPVEPQIAEAQRREFFAQLHRWSRQGHSVVVFCNNEGERQRFTEILRDYGFADDTRLVTRLGALTRGFIFADGKLVVVTDAEIFGRYKVQRPRRLKSAHALATRSALDIDFADLEEGDYVVHLQHGIGRYIGLGRLPVAKGRKPPADASASTETVSSEAAPECLVIEYAANDPAQPSPKLYVPVNEAHLVSKYVGTGKARPPLNTLGGTRWQKTKAQASEAVRDLAAELLEIQAARELQPGHAFALDNSWQREFESSFLYEETVDQMRAIVETKSDMETNRPMDRLICGDVGYGKTEVAIRAAFKAVMGGKQVALLVPTTVLAQQHFNTFRERMSDYPI
ncbi:MAG: DEAD/DEAH box helicase, partial [Verrucomicrobia bacterium]|nr:DEAD/DEAH box helicase [Verrucomicrobiota bacterium]